MFLLFSKLHNIECKNKIDFSFPPICSTDCTLQSGILNSTCKNRDIRLVSSRWVTFVVLGSCNQECCEKGSAWLETTTTFRGHDSGI